MLSSITVSQCASAHDSVEYIAPSELSIRENMPNSLFGLGCNLEFVGGGGIYVLVNNLRSSNHGMTMFVGVLNLYDHEGNDTTLFDVTQYKFLVNNCTQFPFPLKKASYQHSITWHKSFLMAH